MGSQVEARACPVVVRRGEDKSVGVSLTLLSLGFSWSVPGLPTGEGLDDPASGHSVFCVVCVVCDHLCPRLQSLIIFFVTPCLLCIPSSPVVNSTSQIVRGLGRALPGVRSHCSVNRARYLPGHQDIKTSQTEALTY